ncbi:MAG: hypothetical protein COA83_09760 [Methylophaga sp.]|nr:MAG: hypothetical protein COA83_09760 [Methylophaga sp.]
MTISANFNQPVATNNGMLVFNFGGSSEFDITGSLFATLQPAVAVFDALVTERTNRFLTSCITASNGDAVMLAKTTHFATEQAAPENLCNVIPITSASSLSHKSAVIVEQSTLIQTHTISIVDNATNIFTKTASVQDQLDLLTVKRAISIDDAEPVYSKAQMVTQQMTVVNPDAVEIIFQYSGRTNRSFQRSYWHNDGAPYPLILNTIDLQHESISHVEVSPTATYISNNPITFNFSNDQYVAPIPLIANFKRDLIDISYNVYNDLSPMVISPDLTILESSQQLDVTISSTNGVITTTECFSQNAATEYNKKKLCAIVEEAKQPERGLSVWVDLPRPDPPDIPPSGATYTIPIEEVYTMEHTVSVTLADLTAIEMNNLSLKFDADSFAWQFNGDLLDQGQLSLVKPLANGTPIKLIVTINGTVWHVLADLINHRRVFGERTISVTGRGISTLLAAPNEHQTSGAQGSLLTVQQLADQHLPGGWTINWQAVIWNVTGGAYSWQGRTPLQAIADIAAAAGAIILPGRDSQILTIKPRYPVLPWNFAATPVDVAIADAAILELTHRQTSQQFANGVYIHGSEIGGKLGFCRLSGTAGDVLIETQSNALMTDVIGLRAAGERLLAGQYTQPDISSIKMEMDGTIVPFIDVGTFVGITVDGVETKGVVSGVEISASDGHVEQTITIGEETSSQWVAFKSLLPKDPLLVGTLTSTTGTTAIIQLIDGGVAHVRGTGTVNSKVYIRSGQIQGDAPNLVQSEIVI